MMNSKYQTDMVYNVTLKLLDWIFENHYAIGLDGVDLSTVMPKLNDDKWIPKFHQLEQQLHKYNINPIYTMDNVEFSNGKYTHQNVFRLFYSIDSPIQQKRNEIIPNATPISNAIKLLKKYENGIPQVIFHHLLVDSLNDSQNELNELIEFMSQFKDNELRILRYNGSNENTLHESNNFITQIKKLNQYVNFLKIQVSPGNEISAACGQFIVKDFIRTKKKKIALT